MNKKSTLKKVKIKKHKDGNWNLRDEKGRNKGTLKVKRNSTVHWHTLESEAKFKFSKDVNDYFKFKKGLFENGESQKIAKGEKLKLTVKNTAPLGELEYNIYLVDADDYVVGNSPPVMIILR